MSNSPATLESKSIDTVHEENGGKVAYCEIGIYCANNVIELAPADSVKDIKSPQSVEKLATGAITVPLGKSILPLNP